MAFIAACWMDSIVPARSDSVWLNCLVASLSTIGLFEPEVAAMPYPCDPASSSTSCLLIGSCEEYLEGYIQLFGFVTLESSILGKVCCIFALFPQYNHAILGKLWRDHGVEIFCPCGWHAVTSFGDRHLEYLEERSPWMLGDQQHILLLGRSRIARQTLDPSCFIMMGPEEDGELVIDLVPSRGTGSSCTSPGSERLAGYAVMMLRAY